MNTVYVHVHVVFATCSEIPLFSFSENMIRAVPTVESVVKILWSDNSIKPLCHIWCTLWDVFPSFFLFTS